MTSEKIYQKVRVQLVRLTHEDDHGDDPARYRDQEVTHFERMPSLMELLDFMNGMELKDQVYMTCNLLTVAGYSQREIAQAIGVNPATYRTRLLAIRERMRHRDQIP